MSVNLSSSECVPGDLKVATVDISVLQYIDAPGKLTTIPDWEIALKISFYILAMLLDIVGNSIVILIIFLNTKMRTTTNTLIANLAVSDLMVACFCMWVHAGNQVTPNWPFGNFFCKINTFFQVLAVTASVLTMMIIAVERFFVVVFPFRRQWSSRVTFSVIVATWIVAIATAAPQLAVRTQFEIQFRDRKDTWCDEDWPEYYIDKECNFEAPGKKIYYVVEAVVMYFVPIAVMLFTYSVIAYKLLSRKRAGNAPASGKMSSQDRAKRKVTKMLVIVLCVFIVCWTPQQVLLLNTALNQNAEDPSYMPTVNYIALYMAYFSSAINPILYAGFNENFRRGFLEAFKCILVQRRNRIDPDANLSPTPHTDRAHSRTPGPLAHPPVYTNPHDEHLKVPGDEPVGAEKHSIPPPVVTELQDANSNSNGVTRDSAYGSVPSATAQGTFLNHSSSHNNVSVTQGKDYLSPSGLSVIQDKDYLSPSGLSVIQDKDHLSATNLSVIQDKDHLSASSIFPLRNLESSI